jgi:hypothetical protein
MLSDVSRTIRIFEAFTTLKFDSHILAAHTYKEFFALVHSALNPSVLNVVKH